jgi:hypothetical protein
LPEGTVIDLAGSGPGQDGVFPVEIAQSESQLMLTFNPDGTVHRLLYSDAAGELVEEQILDTLVLLVGKREFIASEPAKANWRQPNSHWIAIAAATGNITTAENAVIANTAGGPSAAALSPSASGG